MQPVYKATARLEVKGQMPPLQTINEFDRPAPVDATFLQTPWPRTLWKPIFRVLMIRHERLPNGWNSSSTNSRPKLRDRNKHWSIMRKRTILPASATKKTSFNYGLKI